MQDNVDTSSYSHRGTEVHVWVEGLIHVLFGVIALFWNTKTN